jgi:hypothetical protein
MHADIHVDGVCCRKTKQSEAKERREETGRNDRFAGWKIDNNLAKSPRTGFGGPFQLKIHVVVQDKGAASP